MTAPNDTNPTINWYRIPIPPKEMRKCNRRSDLKGFLQAGGFLLVYASTGAMALYAWTHWAWWITLLLVYLHGTIHAFLLNGFHELCHNTVFQTRRLNEVFLRIYSFLGFFNYVHFQESHRRHHKYTLHPEGDQEVTLPITYSLKSFFKFQFINVRSLINNPKAVLRVARGKITGAWTDRILPLEGPSRRNEYIRWARIMLVGHSLIIVVSLALGYWLVPILFTFAYAYGGWLRFLCNETQHVGLRNNVPDFRLCCRTITLNPVLQFLYWHMNYHIEHHMYAGIPCYNLPRLHRLIKDQLPPSPRGLVATWRQIGQLMERQKREPNYQYTAPLPEITQAQPHGQKDQPCTI